jgi:hypothetical protein
MEELIPSYPDIASAITEMALAEGDAYRMLAELVGTVGPRLSGSRNAMAAIQWGERMMREQGLENIRTQPVMVPHWVRGSVEDARLLSPVGDGRETLNICALGGSIATPDEGIEGDLIEVDGLEAAEALGERGRGAILFFNRPMDRRILNTFEAYGDAVDQRVSGAAVGGKIGAAAVLVRSVTTSIDSFPHTGVMYYEDGIPPIPAAAISTADADYLSKLLATGGKVRIRLRLDCATLPDVEAANVMGEIPGAEIPHDVIVVGGHLDSWDIDPGAHDDGAGCAQAIEALRIIRTLGLRPKRTIRAVLYANEENGLRGGRAYAESIITTGERHIAAIESDRGGFTPRGFSIDAGEATVDALARWSELFEPIGGAIFRQGSGGADIAPLKVHGAVPIGLLVDPHRYFDLHHSAKDTLDTVNERELHLGAAAIALLAYLLAMEGAS